MSSESEETPEAKRQMIDIYKIRIEEYDRNFYSLRDVEWRTAIQFMTGYIAIGLAFNQIRPGDGPAFLLPVVSIGLLLSLFATFFYFRLMIQYRLTWARKRRIDFSKKLHELYDETRLQIENDYNLPGVHWYTFRTQLGVHLLTVLAIIAFVVAKWQGMIQ
jgi:hypothetical protein